MSVRSAQIEGLCREIADLRAQLATEQLARLRLEAALLKACGQFEILMIRGDLDRLDHPETERLLNEWRTLLPPVAKKAL